MLPLLSGVLGIRGCRCCSSIGLLLLLLLMTAVAVVVCLLVIPTVTLGLLVSIVGVSSLGRWGRSRRSTGWRRKVHRRRGWSTRGWWRQIRRCRGRWQVGGWRRRGTRWSIGRRLFHLLSIELGHERHVVRVHFLLAGLLFRLLRTISGGVTRVTTNGAFHLQRRGLVPVVHCKSLRALERPVTLLGTNLTKFVILQRTIQ